MFHMLRVHGDVILYLVGKQTSTYVYFKANMFISHIWLCTNLCLTWFANTFNKIQVICVFAMFLRSRYVLRILQVHAHTWFATRCVLIIKDQVDVIFFRFVIWSRYVFYICSSYAHAWLTSCVSVFTYCTAHKCVCIYVVAMHY